MGLTVPFWEKKNIYFSESLSFPRFESARALARANGAKK